MEMTELQARVTKTAAFDGASLDVSGITGDWTINIQVEELTADKMARFVVEDSVNDFTGSLAGPSFSFKGSLSPASDKVRSVKKDMFPNLRLGVASSKLRIRLSELGSGASVTYRAWITH